MLVRSCCWAIACMFSWTALSVPGISRGEPAVDAACNTRAATEATAFLASLTVLVELDRVANSSCTGSCCLLCLPRWPALSGLPQSQALLAQPLAEGLGGCMSPPAYTRSWAALASRSRQGPWLFPRNSLVSGTLHALYSCGHGQQPPVWDLYRLVGPPGQVSREPDKEWRSHSHPGSSCEPCRPRGVIC